MSLKNRTFINKQTGERVTIIDSFQNIAITDKKDRVDANRLLDTNFYTEDVIPQNHLDTNSTYNMFAEAIRGIDTSKLPDDGMDFEMPNNYGSEYQPATNESAVYMADPDSEVEELKRKYGAEVSNRSEIERQNAAFDRILNPDSDDTPVVQRSNRNQPQPQQTNKKEYVQPDVKVNPPTQQPTPPKQDDPMVSMFKNTKRSVDFTVSIDIENKIPRLDFIEMMEDAYSVSIIDYLADEFLQDILKDPKKIRENIKRTIRKMVYGEENIQEDNEVIEEPVEKQEKPIEKKEKSKKIKVDDTKMTKDQRELLESLNKKVEEKKEQENLTETHIKEDENSQKNESMQE